MTITTTRTETEAPIAELLEHRWSPRGYNPDHTLSEQEITSLLEAARWTPSASNTQPWGFIVGRRGTETFAKIHASLMDFNKVWNENVSVLIVALARTEIDGKHITHAFYDLGQAAAHLTFQAESMGLNAHQMSGIHADQLHEQFEIPENYEAFTVIAVGEHSTGDNVPEPVRDRDAQPRGRKPLDEVILSFE